MSPTRNNELMSTVQNNYKKRKSTRIVQESEHNNNNSSESKSISSTSQLSDLSYQSKDYHSTQQDLSTPSVKKQSSGMSDSMRAGIGEGFLDKLTQKEVKIDDTLDIVAHSEEAYHLTAL
jgi:DNA-nicking Smr family endonuclease